YFKQNVLVEPLFNQWYAWSNLIPPASSAMYIANSHIKIMESFVAAPQAHISALKNPAMLGGPFINYDAGKVGEIRQLLDRTKKEQAHMLELERPLKASTKCFRRRPQANRSNPSIRKSPTFYAVTSNWFTTC